MQFNGGTQIHTFDNLFIHGGAGSSGVGVPGGAAWHAGWYTIILSMKSFWAYVRLH